MSVESSKRPYRLKQRAEGQERTRARITEALLELHGSVGPAHTTVRAVAERAGVQRATVYRHFATEQEQFAACSGLWMERNPPPDIEAWAAVTDPADRLARALPELYGWYRRNEAMLANLIRDEDRVEVLGPLMAGFWGMLTAAAEVLLAGRRLRGRRRERVAAALAHAVDFAAWRSLTSRGLDDAEAADLMAALVTAAERPRP